jgi:MSHA pilin protein MshA
VFTCVLLKARAFLRFTLIELVVVILLLGILAATALLRFLDVSTDARIAKHESLEGSMRTASSMVNAKAIMQNKIDCSTDLIVEMQSETITLRCGYPCPHPSGIENAVVAGDGFSWVGANCSGLLGNILVQISDAPDLGNCQIRYAASRGNGPPSFSVINSGC